MTENSNPSVSVIICTYNGEKGISACLRGLMAQEYPKDKLAIIVVDDGCTDNTRAIATDMGVQVVSHGKNRGVQHARNTGLQHANTEIVAYLDDDCVVAVDWLKQLVAPFSDPKVSAVGGRVIALKKDRLSERYMEATGYGNPEPLAPAAVSGSRSLVRRLYAYLHSMYQPMAVASSPIEVQAVYTANVAYRASAMRAIAGFDSSLRSNEDSDVAERLRAAGGKLMCAPGATARHRHHQRVWHFIRQTFYRSGDTYIYYRKNGMLPPIFPFPLVYVAGIALLSWFSPLAGFVWAVAGPAMLYNSWILHGIRAGSFEYVVYAYIQMTRETAALLGFLRGAFVTAGPRGVAGAYATRSRKK